MTTLNQLRKQAAKMQVRIETQRDDMGWGYWLIDAGTGNGVWADDNFCTTLDEVEEKLCSLQDERTNA